MRKDHMAYQSLEDRMFQDVIIARTVGRLFCENLSPINIHKGADLCVDIRERSATTKQNIYSGKLTHE